MTVNRTGFRPGFRESALSCLDYLSYTLYLLLNLLLNPASTIPALGSSSSTSNLYLPSKPVLDLNPILGGVAQSAGVGAL